MNQHAAMTGKIYSGTYTSTILLTDTLQNPVTLTGAIIASGSNAATDSGFYSSVAFAWSITNLGRITATGATSYGIALLQGGTIANGSIGGPLASITSDETGIFITGAAATVTNHGSIAGTAGRGVFLEAGGTLTNGSSGAAGATISGGFEGVAVYNAGAGVTNFGTILATETFGLGVEIYAGTVANMAGGQIGGAYGVGFVARTTAGTLTNAGTITGRVRDGVEFSGGGTVTNSGSISGALSGVLALYGTASVANTGTITGLYAGVNLLDGGSLTNAAGARISGGFGVSIGNGTLVAPVGTVTNRGVISGSAYEGVSLAAGGSLANSGSIYGRAAGAVAFYGVGSVLNTGSIRGNAIGVKLEAGGTLANAAGATVAGSYGVVLANGPLSGMAATPSMLTNGGDIAGSGSFGAELLTNGLFVNQAGGTIGGGRYGAYIESVTGTIANYGQITGQIGVYGRAVVANNHQYPGQITVLNAGTITGSSGVSVSLFASHDLLIDEPGAVFVGAVDGGGGRLELAAGTGTIGAVASSLASFATITVDTGANWAVAGTMAAAGTLIDLGTLRVTATNARLAGTVNGVGSIDIGRAGNAIAPGAIGLGEHIVFTDPTARLTLLSPAADAATQAGFAAGDTIYLPNQVTAGLTRSYAGGANGGTLTLADGGSTVAKLAFLGQYTAASFAIGADRNGGTDVSIPCFLAGTRIATGAGEVPVERLCIGDEVLTEAGRLRPIVWLGRRDIDLTRHPDPSSVRPIRIAAHAFAPGRPARDLLLSPDHAIVYAGVLIPVHLLITGGAIRPDDFAVARYHHVELESHDVLLAEGLAVESYLDTGNRHLLGLADAAGLPRRAATPCAPLVLGGGVVARARRHLLARGRPKRRHDDPAVRVEACGIALAPVRRTAGRLWFLVPPEIDRIGITAGDTIRVTAAFLDGRLLSPAAAGSDLLLPSAAAVCRSLELMVARSSAAAAAGC